MHTVWHVLHLTSTSLSHFPLRCMSLSHCITDSPCDCVTGLLTQWCPSQPLSRNGHSSHGTWRWVVTLLSSCKASCSPGPCCCHHGTALHACHVGCCKSLHVCCNSALHCHDKLSIKLRSRHITGHPSLFRVWLLATFMAAAAL